MALKDFTLEGKVALVTGASRGLGNGVALALGEAGANLALAARSPEPLEETARAARGLGRVDAAAGERRHGELRG